MARIAAARLAAAERGSHFWTTPGWRGVRRAADRLLLVAAVGAIGWTAVNTGFVADRAIANRGAAILHLGSQPEVKVAVAGGTAADKATGTDPGDGAVGRPVMPTGTLVGTHSEGVSISIVNDGPDGLVVKRAVLSGPYLDGPVDLVANRKGYVAGGSGASLSGTVTVNCAAAAQVARSLVAGQSVLHQAATAIAITMDDANGKTHQTVLTIDTTAMAVQGRMCTK
ncbi:MAG: hypothetical protein ACRDVE_21390 [Actinocrinis sp.]